ncbi:hypothetical protein Avbf_18556 [Armadillidium vulgare]|nr:hypothetical protein Avbf_18556 [Armadillidium vulgare]
MFSISAVGSLTALAAAGALISAPFFLRNFGASAREDEGDYYNGNRRASTGGFPPEQYIDTQDGKPTGIRSPEWMNDYEKANKVYSPKVNPHYSEPLFSLHATQPVYNSNNANDDEAYNKYLNENNRPVKQHEELDQIAQSSALVGNQEPNSPVYNPNNNYNYATARPVYKHPTQYFGPSTESGFKPLPGEDNARPQSTSLVKEENKKEIKEFESKKVDRIKENIQEVQEQMKKMKNKYEGFSSIKSVSIYKPPETKKNLVQNSVKIVPSKKSSPKISPVTSGIFTINEGNHTVTTHQPSPLSKTSTNQFAVVTLHSSKI